MTTKASSVLNGIYKLKNSSGSYDTIYFKTTSEQVIDSSTRRFVTDTEKTTWNNKANLNGSTSVDFNAKTLQASSIKPIQDNVSNLGESNRRWNTVNTNILKANSIALVDTDNILSLLNSVVALKGSTGQSVTIESKTSTNIVAADKVNINSASVEVSGNLNTKGALHVSGALNLKDKINVKDNYITVNSDETGAGITATDKKAGIKIERGTEKDYLIVFDENDDLLKAGVEDSLDTIATRTWASSNFNKYVHPESHPASMITQDTTHKFVTDAEKTTWNGKANAVHSHASSEITDATNANTANKIVKRDASGNFSAGTITATLSGNASSATKLQTARTINGVAFDGTQNITIKAEALAHHHDSAYLKLSGGNASGNIIFDNDTGVYGRNAAGIAYTLARVLNTDTAYLGTTSLGTMIASSNNPKVVVGSNEYTIYHQGFKPTPGEIGAAVAHDHPYRPNTWVPTWDQVTGKPSTFTPSSHTHTARDISTMTGYAKPSTTSAIAVGDTLNVAIGKLEKSLDGKAASKHTHNASEDITGLGSAAFKTVGVSNGNIPVLDSNGKLPESTLPSIAINEKFTATTKAEALKVKVEVGDIMILTADSESVKTFVCIDSAATTFDEKFKALSSSADYISKPEVTELLKNKVDKISGKGLSTNDYTTTEKNKLAGIAANANNYVHPANHAASMITQDTNNRFVTDAEKTKWNSKSDAHSHPYLNLSGGKLTGNIEISNSSPELTITNTASNDVSLLLNRGGSCASWRMRHSVGDLYLECDWTSSKTDFYKVLTLAYNTGNVTAKGDIYAKGGQKVYHTGNKPTAAEVGASPSNHNHDSVYRKQTDITFDMIKIATPAA